MKNPVPNKALLVHHPLVRLFLIIAASVLMAINLKTFVHAGGLYPGGFTGLSLLIIEIFSRFFGIQIPFVVINTLLNSVPAFVSFKFIGRRFTLYSGLMILLSGILTDLIPVGPMTQDVLLSAVFGGLLNACAVTLCLVAGATSGGTDFVAIYFSQKYGRDVWNYILIFNILVLCAAGILFGWDKALYSIIFQYTSTQALRGMYRRYQQVTLLIVTDKPQVAYKIIRDETNHDATEIEGTGCYQRSKKTILYSVISADEAHHVRAKIREVDPDAFVNVIKSHKIQGRFYNPPRD
ncbi:MAG: YitT family protein [Spirochaetaceae bacterium]|nr:YitT family protein [Spirochaetaceae bacterium]